MKTVIQLTDREEARALPILLRHSTGMVLLGRTYVISSEAAGSLAEAGVKFTELTRETSIPGTQGAVAGERI